VASEGDNKTEASRAAALRERAREIGRRGHEELTRKGGLPDSAHGFLRRWFRRVWELRGGGAYAIGFGVTFLYLEINDILFDDIPTLFAMDLTSVDSLIGFVVSFIIDTLMNTLVAFVWPALLLSNGEIYGLVALVAIFTLFPRYLKKPIEHWLFEGEPPPVVEKKKKRKKKRRPEEAA